MDRKRMLNTFKAAAEVGAYDEFPVLAPGIDPQVYLSRNDRPQPFYLICEKDSLLVQVAGTGRLHMKYSPVLWEAMQPGDFVYVPAGTPHRYVPTTESVQTRYKADPAGLEGVAWFCEGCGTEIARDEWDTAECLSQDGYWQACQAFNTSLERRTCPSCSQVHPQLDLSGTRWQDIAAQLRENVKPAGARA
jgi:3-hydroxyanthranilate 3,4-dioxygenase